MTLEETISQMAEDKSNDWAEEIETLIEVEKELDAYRANVGSVEGIVAVSRYARLGKIVAASIGSEREWNDCDEYLDDFAASAKAMGLPDPSSPATLEHYRKLADSLGIEYETDDEEEDDTDQKDEAP